MGDLIRVLIVDDHPVVRQGLAGLLIPRNGMKIVGEATSGREAVELASQTRPDVIVMDLVMPDISGTEATAQIRARDKEARILILTSYGKADGLIEAIEAGASGCLLKDTLPDDLLHAIRSVHRGQMSIPRVVAEQMLHEPAPVGEHQPLTGREQEVASLVAKGMSNQEIAQRLSISTNTVRSHVSNILRKLALDNRTQLALYARDAGS